MREWIGPPLWEVWDRWWRERPDTCRDEDGLELVRAKSLATDNLRTYSAEEDAHVSQLADYEAGDWKSAVRLKHELVVSDIS